MKKVCLIFLSGFFLTVYYGCSKDNEILESEASKVFSEQSQVKPLNPKLDENLYSEDYLQEFFEKNKTIDWIQEKDPKLFYSIASYTDNIYLISYKAEGFGKLKGNIDKIDLKSKEWVEAKDAILKLFETDDPKYVNRTGKLGDNLPMLLIESTSFKSIEKLVKLEIVSSIEVSLDIMMIKWLKAGPLHQVGCNCQKPVIDDIDPNDYDVIAPDVKQPWNYKIHNIDQAWESTPEEKRAGKGIGVAVIDTGASEDQGNLSSDFNSGQSQGRIIGMQNFLDAYLMWVISPYAPISVLVEHQSIVPLSSHDRCAHGTKMAGVIGAPRGDDGNSVGIAYNCDLYVYRALHNAIIITTTEKAAVAASLADIALKDDIQIISMSIGQLPWQMSSAIDMGLEDAYNAGKMMVCAAGTGPLQGFDYIAFPANSSYTVAATGIRTPSDFNIPLTDADSACNICHKGEGVDFAVVMQHPGSFNSSENTSLGLYCEGDVPGYVSGASTAASSLSGMAALVWANEGPSATREQILEKLVSASSNGGSPITNYGNGWVDVSQALQ